MYLFLTCNCIALYAANNHVLWNSWLCNWYVIVLLCTIDSIDSVLINMFMNLHFSVISLCHLSRRIPQIPQRCGEGGGKIWWRHFVRRLLNIFIFNRHILKYIQIRWQWIYAVPLSSWCRIWLPLSILDTKPWNKLHSRKYINSFDCRLLVLVFVKGHT